MATGHPPGPQRGHGKQDLKRANAPQNCTLCHLPQCRCSERRLPPFRVLSYGAGADSFAMLLIAAQTGDLPNLVIFADVTDPAQEDPGEWPGSYQHMREHAMPLCARLGIPFVWLGTDLIPIRGERSLFAYFEKNRFMPARTSRLCTSAAKVERIGRWLDGAVPGRRVEMWIGFEAGEDLRMANDPHAAGLGKPASFAPSILRTSRFPLAEWGLCRCRCEAYIRASGYPVPRKSACMYCPFSSRGDFQTLARELPTVFIRVQQLEDNCRTTKSGKTLRYGYKRGDGTDPTLTAWIAPAYKARGGVCDVCGGPRATKATGCSSLT